MNDWRRLDSGQWSRLLTDAGAPQELVEPLTRYLLLLARWEGAVDLLGRVDPLTLVREHVLESLAGLAVVPSSGSLLDVGSGNGFPAVPLLLGQPTLDGVLLEPRERRWAFLREVARELSLAVDVRRERLEEHRGGEYAALTVRAVKAGAWRLRAGSLVRAGGVLLCWATTTQAARLTVPGMEPVLTSPLPVPERGVIAVWRRCST